MITGCVKNGPGGAPQPLAPHGLPFKTVHPLFTAGAGYVLSGDLLGPLYLASLDIKIVRVEDAFLTGYCARAVEGLRNIITSILAVESWCRGSYYLNLIFSL